MSDRDRDLDRLEMVTRANQLVRAAHAGAAHALANRGILGTHQEILEAGALATVALAIYASLDPPGPVS